MVLWNLYKRRQEAHLEQVVAKARAEALAQADREWTTWYNRMMEAQAKGLPFDVPPPANLREPAE